MPKEHIYTVGRSEQYEIQVGWAADRDVQVGLELHDAREDLPGYEALIDFRSLLWQLFGDRENLIRFGVAMRNWTAPVMSQAQIDQVARGEVAQLTADADLYCDIAIDVLMLLQDDWKPTGIWTTLTREDCNQLIKVLRRARDNAYGRDE